MSPHDYGVVYTPSNVGHKLAYSDSVVEDYNIRFIRIYWSDLINNIRVRVVSTSYFKKLLQSSRPGISVAKITFGLVYLVPVPGFSGTGEYLYAIDLSTFKLCPFAPGHASVMGVFQEKTPVPEYGLSVPLCPRSLLGRVVEDALARSGVSVLVGFESEFILLKETSPKIVTVGKGDWSLSSKLPSGSIESVVLQEIAENLESAGIELQMYHGEAAPGQYEVITGPLTPLESADALILTRETIYNTASKHGLRATFAPRLHSYSCGSAAHTHISVHSTNSPARDSDKHLAPTLTSVERSFLQGMLAHLPALAALALPTSHSYARMLDGIWSGGTYAAWGYDNRESAIRLCGSPGSHNFEVRFVDGTSSPYLVLAGLIGAGVQAISENIPLATGDCAKPVAVMTEEERAHAGVQNVGRLPTTIDQARKILDADKVVRNALGDHFVDTYLAVNQTLEKCLKGETEDETVTKLVEFY